MIRRGVMRLGLSVAVILAGASGVMAQANGAATPGGDGYDCGASCSAGCGACKTGAGARVGKRGSCLCRRGRICCAGEYGPYRAKQRFAVVSPGHPRRSREEIHQWEECDSFSDVEEDTRIQLDLHESLKIDKILLGTTELKYVRDSGAVFVDFPETLHAGQEYTIDFYYSGNPLEEGTLRWICVPHPILREGRGSIRRAKSWVRACGGRIKISGATKWKTLEISVAVPNDLVDVSNGQFVGKTDLGDGYTRWDWKVHYPINNYDVSVNIGKYVHFSDKLGDLALDYYVLPEDLEKAKVQFAQSKGMLEAYEHYFGEYSVY